MLFTIAQARSGDPCARETLMRALARRVDSCSRYYARRCGSDADDLRQEMWLGIYAALERVDLTVGDPLQFLIAQGRFALLNYLRKQRRECVPLEAVEELRADDSVEDDIVDLQLAESLVGSLDEKGRKILGCLLQGHSKSDTARMLHCTPANITYHLRRIEGSLVSAFDLGGARNAKTAS